ncbi:hypothetical protein Ngar_c07760 [Candidatus Nitrososphaera gargensis Ga9.2]|uniref:ArnR1-like winged helix-turn-helix domain-containing protein n=1 Tax=Nitrososphaera gargensis (strain Ga9.2) TaxID=1237085 RepID=K0IFY6_NITGG|nr:winged helix-turn-helix domain-containing protein [Candidatus Nitrososphaera gargensis]AFU57718.1 hypothetical protein Ngar_c07760 [Candidatus Nitrososphaera gargensis Ga9.2]
MKYAYRTYVAARILDAVKNGAKTNSSIMHEAFVSYDALRRHLDVLIGSGLLQYFEPTRRYYQITEKGLQFLRLYNRAEEMICMASSCSA